MGLGPADGRPRRRRFLPKSLASRTTLVLLFVLTLVQIAGLGLHVLDRLDVQREGSAMDVSERVIGVYRAIMSADPAQRSDLLEALREAPGVVAEINAKLTGRGLPEMPPELQQMFRDTANVVPVGLPHGHWKDMRLFGTPDMHEVVVAFHMPDGNWLNVSVPGDPHPPVHRPIWVVAFAVMTLAAMALSFWSVRRLTGPVRTLAAAAEALGRDVNAPPLPEDGPSEVAKAAAAFNQMASRIRRFVADRTELLTAIGHDLRTPITRLKLRAEFMEDEEQRLKMLNDLEELEAMVSATLAFGRDARTSEPAVPIDLAELLRTILDEAGDARPDLAHALSYHGPAHLTFRARALSLKRALSNLVNNALNYGGSAQVTLSDTAGGTIRIDIEDSGPGIPPDEMDRVFEPFRRGDLSRNRETGGVGLGLPIARNIVRAHGGDIVLANRPEGGAKATVTLPT